MVEHLCYGNHADENLLFINQYCHGDISIIFKKFSSRITALAQESPRSCLLFIWTTTGSRYDQIRLPFKRDNRICVTTVAIIIMAEEKEEKRYNKEKHM